MLTVKLDWFAAIIWSTLRAYMGSVGALHQMSNNLIKGHRGPAINSKGLPTKKKTFFESLKKIPKKMWPLSSRGAGGGG